MEMTLLERAARAVLPHITDEMNMPFDQGELHSAPAAWDIARAVLEAIREPSDEMVEAIPYADKSFMAPVTAPRDFAVAGWRKMIDAALGEVG